MGVTSCLRMCYAARPKRDPPDGPQETGAAAAQHRIESPEHAICPILCRPHWSAWDGRSAGWLTGVTVEARLVSAIVPRGWNYPDSVFEGVPVGRGSRHRRPPTTPVARPPPTD